MNNDIQLSIVLPIYNEAESIPHLLAELTPALETTGCTFEIICVDDGSNDGSFEELKKRHAQDERVRVIRFRRNFGTLRSSRWWVTGSRAIGSSPASSRRPSPYLQAESGIGLPGVLT